MEFNLYFDISALIILAFIAASILLRKRIQSSGSVIFLIVVIISMVCTALDILASIPSFPVPLLFVLNTFFIIFRALTAASLFVYACNAGKFFYIFVRKKWPWLLFSIPLFFFTLLCVINFWNKQVFDYFEGPNGPAYARGPLMLVAYIVSYFYVALAILFVILGRKRHTLSQTIAVFSALVLQIAASVIQYFYGQVLIEMLVMAVTLLTLSLFIEAPENHMDFKTNNPTFSAFASETEERFLRGEKFGVIFIRVTNSSGIYNLYPYNQAVAFNRACSASVLESTRKIDRSANVYYLGDGTFAYVFKNVGVGPQLLQLINHSFAVPMSHNGISYRFVSKTCFVKCPEEGDDIESLIGFSTAFHIFSEHHTLDLAPYATKAGNLLFHLDRVLERAIKERLFTLSYQPIYDVKTKKFVASEALIRLNDQDFGFVSPGLMIPYAETTGKITQIGNIVLELAFAFVPRWAGKLEYVEINLSAVQLSDPTLASQIESLAVQYSINPSKIVFEVTESAAVLDSPALITNIDTLVKMGYRIAIDDFGTGYSNLSRLLQLPIHVLKYDKSITDMFAASRNSDFFLALLQMFQKRSAKILFEGVEDLDVAEDLARLGVDHIQGYCYSKPLPEEEFLKKISEQ